MSRVGFIGVIGLVLTAALAVSSEPARAADGTDNTRGVTIIDAPSELPPLSDAPPAPIAILPAPAAPTLPALPPPRPVSPAVAAPSPASPTPAAAKSPGNTIYDVSGVQPRPVDLSPTGPRPLDVPERKKQASLGAIAIDSKVANSAQVSIDLAPGVDIAVGSKVSFRVTTKKPGYLILVDIDANGKLTQIYPVPNALVGSNRPARPRANYIAAGKPLDIPTAGDTYAGIEYVAAPPLGVAMIVAILSDQPVQILDLPDVPSALAGQAEALAFLTKTAQELRIPQAGSGRLQEARWSFDAKLYAIR